MKTITQQTEPPFLWLVKVDGEIVNAFAEKEKAENYDINLPNLEDLRVFKFIKQNISSIDELLQIDFTLLGLVNETPKYGNKGIKQMSSYTHDNLIVVEKLFNYLEKGLEITFNYYLNDGNIGVSKTEFKPLDKVEIGKIKKSNRDRTITYLQVSGMGTPIEQFVNALLKRYKNEVDLFIYNDTDDFKNKVISETEQPYLTYLNIQTAPNWTVKDAILKQIS
jgi:hypothetical protein